jgi:hypothetical protein
MRRRPRAHYQGAGILPIEEIVEITSAPVAGPLRRRRRSAFRLAIVLLCGSTGSGLAQQVLPVAQDDLRPGESLQDRFDRRGLIEPIVIGPFQVTALLQGDLGFNDNVFAQATGLKSDFFFDLGAKIHTNYQYGGFSAQLDTNLLDHQFVSLTTEDYWEGNGRLSLRDAPSQDFAYIYQGGVQRLAVPRTDPNPLDGRTPATYLLYDSNVGVAIGNGQRNLLTMTLGYDQTVFDNIPGLNGPIDATQRDRTEFLADLRFDHTFFGQQEVFFELRPNTRNYAQEFDSSGFRQSSNGGRADAGFTLDLASPLLLTVSGGWQQQDYADPRFGAIGEPDAKVDLNWSPTLLTHFDAQYIHEYAEDIDVETPINSPGYVRNEAILSLQHELRRDFLVTLMVSDDFRDLNHSPTRFDLIDIGPKVQYRFSDGLSAGFNLDHIQLSSNTTVHFTDDIGLFTLKQQF